MVKMPSLKQILINKFIKSNNVTSIIEFGCGDGNQLSYFEIFKYIGLDVSRQAIKNCKKKYAKDNSK